MREETRSIPVCQNSECGFVFWQNSKPCASVVIMDNKGLVLMTVRAHEPDKGKWDLPGGFLLEGEHPDAGAKREAKEELGVDIEIIGRLGFVMDVYGDTGEHTLNIGFVAMIKSGTPLAADDAESLKWIDPKNVDPSRLAFTNNEKFLQLFLDWRSVEKPTKTDILLQ